MLKGTKIHVLTIDNNPNSFSFLFPLLINRKGLLERDINLKVFYSLKESIYDCDIVFVDSKFFKSWWQKNREEDIYKFLKNAKKKVKAVLWFDTSDSTGTPQFKVLPYVDSYYKNQILKDLESYFKSYCCARIFSDYYHKKFKITDETETGCELPLDPAYINKIYLSWNSGLSDHGLYSSSYSKLSKIMSRLRLRRYYPFNFQYTAKFINVNKPRKIDIAARMGLKHKGFTKTKRSVPRKCVRFHRERLMERLKNFNVDMRFVNHTSYYKELQNAKLSISPFGLGEITYRDFETIICGALLIKPDMDHLKTWPDLYKDNQTYVKCDWNFSDLQEKIKDLLSNPKKIYDIAMEAQRNYRYYLFGGGRIDFCDRVMEMIKRHMSL